MQEIKHLGSIMDCPSLAGPDSPSLQDVNICLQMLSLNPVSSLADFVLGRLHTPLLLGIFVKATCLLLHDKHCELKTHFSLPSSDVWCKS